MGLDFSIYVKNKKDADKYFDEIPASMNVIRDEENADIFKDDKSIVWWNCGRALGGFTGEIADKAGKEDETSGKQKVKLGKLQFAVDILNKLRSNYTFAEWEDKDFSRMYYDKYIDVVSEDDFEEYDEELREFNNLEKYVGIPEETVRVIREIDRAHLEQTKKLLDFKRQTKLNFHDFLEDTSFYLDDVGYDCGYLATFCRICKTIELLTEIFGKDYEVAIVNSY